jgi:Papain family cysteine protease
MLSTQQLSTQQLSTQQLSTQQLSIQQLSTQQLSTQQQHDTYDARIRQPGCSAFEPIDQTGCQACCAAALAGAAAARACLRDRRNVVYSVQHIWDCAYFESVSACNDGVRPATFFGALFTKDTTAKVLTPVAWSTTVPIVAPNSSACTAATSKENLTSIKMAENAAFDDESTNALKEEIWEYGPVIAVVHFKQQTDLQIFKNWSMPAAQSQILYPNSVGEGYQSHCVIVIGWGRDYWLVQNSFGLTWGYKGIAMMAQAKWGIERDWFALTPAHLQCSHTNGACLSPHTQPRKNDTDNNDEIPNAAIAAVTITSVFVIAAIFIVCYRPASVALDPIPDEYEFRPRHYY